MEVVDHETPSLENGQTDKEVEENANVLQFMDSMDAYLTLIHSLSSTLRRVRNIFSFLLFPPFSDILDWIDK